MTNRAARGGARSAAIDLVFDGRCGVCTRVVSRLRRLDRRGSLRFQPSQRSGVLERFGLTEEEARSAVWAFQWPEAGAPGSRYRGAAAANRAVDAALGIRLFLPIYRIPGIRWAQDRAYRWIAENRHRLRGTTPWCVEYPEDCGR